MFLVNTMFNIFFEEILVPKFQSYMFQTKPSTMRSLRLQILDAVFLQAFFDEQTSVPHCYLFL